MEDHSLPIISPSELAVMGQFAVLNVFSFVSVKLTC
jgi:hypothetical protein